MKTLYKILSTTSDWSTFFSHANALTKHEKGELFEKLTELVLLTKPVYKARYKNVWLLRDGIDSKLKARLKLPNVDEGIDLIAESYNGSYCSIQCKFKGANESPTRKDIATFLDISRNHCKNISEQILVHTGTSGIKKTALLPDSFTQIGLDFWSQLTEEDWSSIQLLVKGKKVPNLKRTPRQHQQEAITASKQYFLKDKNTRGKLIMPCGTGKSLTAYWITQSLGSKATIIAVPSLALIKQSLEDWTKEMLLSKSATLPEWCCICSDESTGQLTDDFVTDTYSLGIPTTTNEHDITRFLKRKTPGGKIIFTTYQSADKLALASKKLKYKFDLAILDEAHKTVGAKDKAFSILLQEDKINISKRLFMTATERIVKGADDQVLSMDDDKVYGKVIYKLSFKKAIEDSIITDYKIVTVLVNDTEIQDLIKKNRYVTDHGKKVDEAEAQMLTTAIALKKAIKEYNINHTVSFHKSINASKEFQSLYQKIDTTKDSPAVFHISSKLNAGARALLLKDFRNASNAIITNARCLTEGVDVPAIDCVLFADQKQSIVDIVQASGRALRQYTDKNTGVKKEVGYIIIPVVLKEGESIDNFTDSSRFKTLTRIVTSLSLQDETIIEELKLIDAGKQKIGTGKIKVVGNINKVLKINLSVFSSKLFTKLWQRIGHLNMVSYDNAKTFVKTLNIKSIKQWRHLIESNPSIIPPNIPKAPNHYYKGKGWISFPVFFGTRNHRGDVFWSYNEAETFARSLKLKRESEWRRYKAGKLVGLSVLPDLMPKNPDQYYKRKGKKDFNWGDFLGTGNTFKGDFLDFSSVKEYIQQFGFKTWNEWLDYKDGKRKDLPERPTFIPKNPMSVYKNKGWINIGDFLGTGSIANYNKVYLSYDQAKVFVQKLKLKSWSDWRRFASKKENGVNLRPSNIPGKPNITYKKLGWVSWNDWLGCEIQISTINRVYLKFHQARAIVKKLNLKSQKDWNNYCKSGNKPEDIPSNPWLKYKHKGWVGLADWLGTKK